MRLLGIGAPDIHSFFAGAVVRNSFPEDFDEWGNTRPTNLSHMTRPETAASSPPPQTEGFRTALSEEDTFEDAIDLRSEDGFATAPSDTGGQALPSEFDATAQVDPDFVPGDEAASAVGKAEQFSMAAGFAKRLQAQAQEIKQDEAEDETMAESPAELPLAPVGSAETHFPYLAEALGRHLLSRIGEPIPPAAAEEPDASAFQKPAAAAGAAPVQADPRGPLVARSLRGPRTTSDLFESVPSTFQRPGSCTIARPLSCATDCHSRSRPNSTSRRPCRSATTTSSFQSPCRSSSAP